MFTRTVHLYSTQLVIQVLVNCQMGVSRSSALALAYMILYR